VAAATDAFLERGYQAATIEEVARAAGVAPQTVYYAFGTKPRLLAAVLDARIAGDVDPLPLATREWMAAVGTAEDPVAGLAAVAAACVDVLDRVSPVYAVASRAAADPEVGALVARMRAGRRRDQGRIVEQLARAGHVRTDVPVDELADAFYALVNEEVYGSLVVDCGWDLDRFRRWLTGVLAGELLEPDA
jgi:AcrR family transcriptional regulator